jgi:hypothetical protein
LGPGNYYLEVGFDEPLGERHDVHECAVEFEISGQVFEYGPRNALLVSPFDWYVEELNPQQ